MTAPRLTIQEVRFGERDLVLRLPFKFGVTTLRQTPQVFTRVLIELEDGRQAWGEAAELLVPKWFDKSPSLSNTQNLDQLRLALRLAAEAYCSTKQPLTAFAHSAEHYHPLQKTGSEQGLPSLVTSFGGAELDKAILDGVCRALGIGFKQAIRSNIPGMNLQRLAPDLTGLRSDEFLAGLKPLDRVQVRHTIGMLDPLNNTDISPAEKLHDGLPESLEQIITEYGHSYFKIKVSGEIESDLKRLEAIAGILDHKPSAYHITLDGNEQFQDVNEVLTLWDSIKSRDSLNEFRSRILFIEQPIHRDQALSCDLSKIAREVPVIIDESDGTLDAFPLACKLGYRGVSSKACKGLYKSFVNAARCAGSGNGGQAPLFLSAEDLTCQSGLALQQDLALIAALGIGHVERNGHHYVSGMAGAPDNEQQGFLRAHPDLYRSVRGRTCLAIDSGKVQIGFLDSPGFASGADLDWSAMNPMQLSTEG
ncbi:MAG: mandelate racemase [Gammaproteobacteria bacterium]|nr:mandelate racemase [Gammaproteobacteria bacterium]